MTVSLTARGLGRMVCRILVADDSSTIQKVIRIGLASLPNDIRAVGSLVEAKKAVESGQIDIIIAGAGLPGVSSADDFIKLVAHAGHVPIIVLIGSYDAVRESDLRSAGIEQIMKKPFPPGDLAKLVQELTTSSPSPAAQISSAPRAQGNTSQEGFSEIPASRWNLVDPPSNLFESGNIAQSIPQSIPNSLPFSVSSSFDLGDASGVLSAPPIPETEPARKGRPAFDISQPDIPLAQARTASPRSEDPKYQGGGQPGPSQFSGMSAAVEAFVLNELPPLVDRAVERYCIEHFKQVAREALTTELRRLAEEKARFLVDQ